MTWLIWTVPLAAIAIVVIVAVFRALVFKPRPEEPIRTEPVQYDQQKAVDDLQAMIRCATVSSYDHDREDETEFKKFIDLLPERFPDVHRVCSREFVGPRGMLYHWQGRNSEHPTVLMAHYDVVAANASQWDKPPFAGVIEKGELWGRGTLDTKATLNAILQAAEKLIMQGFVPENDIYMAFGGNEEIEGPDAVAMVAEFEKRGITPHLVVDEGGAVVENMFPGVDKPCAVIGTAEKGMLLLEMVAESSGGHASSPPPRSSLGRLAKACLRIEDRPFKMRLSPPAAAMFDTLGRYSTFTYRLIFTNLWLFSGVLNWICRKQGGELNALLRTTVAWTQAAGSSQTNIMPPKASMAANLRLITGDSGEQVMARLNRIIDDPALELRVISCHEPSPVSETGDSASWQKLRQAVQGTWPEAIVSPYLMFACSDARFYSRISKYVYRFSAMAMPGELRKTIHGNNERIRLETIGKTVEFYLRLMSSC